MTTRPYYQATERCSCGATITTDAYTTDDLRETLMAFRRDHRHIVNLFSRAEPTEPDTGHTAFTCTCGTDESPGLIIDPTCPIHGDDATPAPDRRPHSRACGVTKHDHGTACSTNCPTCHGVTP